MAKATSCRAELPFERETLRWIEVGEFTLRTIESKGIPFCVMVPSKPSIWMEAPQAQSTVTSFGSASAGEVHGDC